MRNDDGFVMDSKNFSKISRGTMAFKNNNNRSREIGAFHGKEMGKQQLELDMEQTGSKPGKEYIKVVYCHPAYLTCM